MWVVRKWSLSALLIAITFVGISVLPARANNVPPSPFNSFYGDANGDAILDASDISQMKAWTLGLPYAYDTIQPQTSTQDWNTSDVTSDNLIDASDLSAIKSWTLGLTVTVDDKPWVLSNENLPASIAVNTPTAFQINLASTIGTQFGRAGIPIIANIDSANSTATGSLAGRTCSPVVGSRDQAASAGAQCALSVAVTDWTGAAGPTKGLTETGTYGFSVTGTTPGNLRIIFSISGNPPGLDIPAVSIGMNIRFYDNIWYVKANASGANNGNSWTNAFTKIQDGMNAASSGDMIWVAEGTYFRPSSGAEPVLTMKDGVIIFGGFVGTESNLFERGNPVDHPTILDEQNASSSAVIGASNSSLDGFTITNGNTYAGGGMYAVDVTSLTISNSIFANNIATWQGGGIYTNNSTLTISGCTFINNAAFSGVTAGGAIGHDYGSLSTINNCIFIDNFAFNGGAIYIYDSGPIITNCIFVGNSAIDYGGGIQNEGSASIINCSFNSNSSTDMGGGISNCGFATIINTILWGDTAPNGAEIYGSTTVTYSDVQGSGTYPGTGNINQNPLFIYPGWNLHIGPLSFCRNAGNPSPSYNDPDGTRNDMGAYSGPGTTRFDSDYDGMENWWEILYGLNPTNPSDASGNPEADPWTNLQEFSNSTNPSVYNYFSTSDLQGYWMSHGLTAGDFVGGDGWYWFKQQTDYFGIGTCIEYQSSWGSSSCSNNFGPPVTFSISSDGTITSVGNPPLHAAMTIDKNLSAGVILDDSDGEYDYGIQLMRDSAITYTTSDLQGIWMIHAIGSGGVGQNYWVYFKILMDNFGNYNCLEYRSSYGDNSCTGHIPPGTMSISSDGIVTMAGIPTMHGVMRTSKNIIVGTFTDGGGFAYDVNVTTKMGNTFTLSDLAGTWMLHALVAGDVSGQNGWYYFKINFNGSGIGTCLEYLNSWGSNSCSNNFGPPVTVSISSDGIMTVSGMPSWHGVMSYDKNVFSATLNDGNGGYDLGVGIKMP